MCAVCVARCIKGENSQEQAMFGCGKIYYRGVRGKVATQIADNFSKYFPNETLMAK